jgi:Transglutaminase-like superfamily
MTALLPGTAAPALRRMLDFYRRHTPVSDPGPHAEALRRLPRDPGAVVDILGGIFAHYEFDLPGTGFEPGPDRRAEVGLRTSSAILSRVFELDPAALAEPRPIERKYLGVCRDVSLLLCSALRTHGIPARLRYGTGHHLFVPRRPMHDHVVVEYWSEEESRWKYGDGRMYESVRTECKLEPRYRDDIPAELFFTGAQAWNHGRRNDAAAFKMSGYMLDADAGHWQVRNLFLQDLASLAGWEPLMWDAWGYMFTAKVRRRPRGVLQYRQLDHLATYEPRDPDQWLALMRAYRRLPMVRLSRWVLECSPVAGKRLVSAEAVKETRHAFD